MFIYKYILYINLCTTALMCTKVHSVRPIKLAIRYEKFYNDGRIKALALFKTLK